MHHFTGHGWRREDRGRRGLGLAVGLCLLAGLTLRLWADCVFITPAPRRTLVDEHVFGDYRVRLYDVWEDPAATEFRAMSFEILRGDQRVFSDEGWRLRVCGTNATPDSEAADAGLPPIGTDITGDGQPDLVIYDYSGGAHCCSSFYLFEIGAAFRHIQTLDAAHSEGITFVNLDADPALEIAMLDWSYAYRWSCFACSPVAEVLLKYDGVIYTAAESLMRLPPPTPEELHALADEVRRLDNWSPDIPIPTPAMIGHMLSLVYSGNRFYAWVLMEMVWPDGGAAKETFADEFETALAESPYADAIARLNSTLAWWPENPAPAAP